MENQILKFPAADLRSALYQTSKGDQRDKKVQLVKVPTPYADVRFDAMKYWPKEMPSLPSICTDYVYEMQHVTFSHFRTGLLQGLSEKVKWKYFTNPLA